MALGAKGEQPRQTWMLDRQALTQTENQALTVAVARNGGLIDKPDLTLALANVSNRPHYRNTHALVSMDMGDTFSRYMAKARRGNKVVS